MASVFDVARYILEQEGKLSTWKLQKLCYYAQAWELAWTGRPLFKEDFEAWRNGPVCRDLYEMHKGKYIVSADDIDGKSGNLSSGEMNDIDIVLRDYGDMEPYELREQSHSEKPWIDARNGLPDYANSDAKIEKSEMALYYGSL